jgi:hypothetical protein
VFKNVDMEIKSWREIGVFRNEILKSIKNMIRNFKNEKQVIIKIRMPVAMYHMYQIGTCYCDP